MNINEFIRRITKIRDLLNSDMVENFNISLRVDFDDSYIETDIKYGSKEIDIWGN